MYVFVGNKIITPVGPVSVPNYTSFRPEMVPCVKIGFNDDTHSIISEKTFIHAVNREFDFSKKISLQSLYRYPVKVFPFEFIQECLDPYLIGILLCCRIKNNIFSSTKLNKIKDLNCSYYKVETVEGKIRTDSNYPNILFGDMKNLGLNCRLSIRSIPENYLYSSLEKRKELLRGLISINGKQIKGDRIFHTCSTSLAKDFSTLVRSMGGFAKICEHSCSKRFYKILFSVPFEMDNIKTKARNKTIKEIEKIGNQPCVNIETDELIINNFLKIS